MKEDKQQVQELKYNSHYPSEITYKSDKNFIVRLKAFIDRKMNERGIRLPNEFLESLETAEEYFFESKHPSTPPIQEGVEDAAKKHAKGLIEKFKIQKGIVEWHEIERELINNFISGWQASQSIQGGAWVKVDYPEHGKIILTNIKGDTYTSKSEELIDFLFDAESQSPAIESDATKILNKNG